MNKYTFIHMPRTGGITTTQHLIKCGLMPRKKCQRPAWLLTETERCLPIIGTLRNPLDWYASVYSFSKIREPFAGWLPMFIAAPHLSRTCVWGRQPRPKCFAPIGAFTYFHILYFCSHSGFGNCASVKAIGKFYDDYLVVDRWLRTEQLIADLLELTGSEPVSLNLTNRLPTVDFYDDSLRALVLDRDGWMMEKYGYV